MTVSEVFEDIGYRPGMNYPKVEGRPMAPAKIRIKYVRGMGAGDVRLVKDDIAQDLIDRGYAVEVER
jgi:hypothetical protein